MNLIMITLDCVRPDFLGCYGNQRAQTPNIDRLAARGIVFEQAVSQAPCTWVSHAGIFTGLNPTGHGLRTPFDNISDDAATLAQVLKKAGFNTAGFPANDLVGGKTGLDRGFDLYFEEYRGEPSAGLNANHRNPWRRVMETAELWIAEQKGRFFAWFHYLDTHHLPDPDLPEYYRTHFRPDWQFYEGKIAYADQECVGRIVSMLERFGHLNDTLVVIFSDHGEELGEDGCPRHNERLSDSVLLVPLIISSPSGSLPAARVSGQVGTVDIMPTALRLLGVLMSDIPPMDGRALVAPVSHKIGSSESAGLAYAENLPGGLFALRSAEWKFIKNASGDALYHLPSDPLEDRNVIAQNPLTARFFKGELGKIIQEGNSATLPARIHKDRNGAAYSIDHHEYDETLRALKGLGYL